MREYNGRFWVPRDRKQRRSKRQKAIAACARDLKRTIQHERERAEREASIERKHALALAMAEERRAQDERRTWEEWLGISGQEQRQDAPLR